MIWGVLVSGAAALALGPWGGLVLLPAVGLAAVNAARQGRSRAWALSDEAILYRRGWIWRTLSLARVGKIQALSIVETPFDRRWGMATLQVDTAGGRAGSTRLRMRFLGLDTARHLLDLLGERAGETAFRW